jgi:hypothetical protein
MLGRIQLRKDNQKCNYTKVKFIQLLLLNEVFKKEFEHLVVSLSGKTEYSKNNTSHYLGSQSFLDSNNGLYTPFDNSILEHAYKNKKVNEPYVCDIGCMKPKCEIFCVYDIIYDNDVLNYSINEEVF